MAKRFGDLTKAQKDKILNKPGNKGLTKKEVRDKYNARQENKSNKGDLSSSFFASSNLNNLPVYGTGSAGATVTTPSQELIDSFSQYTSHWGEGLPVYGTGSIGAPASPAPTPAPTPPPYVPEAGFDADELLASLTDALAGIRGDTQGMIGDLTTGFGNQIEGLTSNFNTTISGLQDSINNQASAYEDRIGGLQDQLLANQNTLSTYANQITDLGDQLREAQEKARQVKVTDTSYIGDNNASGVRLNRSNNYNRGAFALGTSQLNRDNMKNLFKINTVNL